MASPEIDFNRLNYPAKREVVRSRYFNDGLNPYVIARELNISARTVRRFLAGAEKISWRGTGESRRNPQLEQQLNRSYNLDMSFVVNLPDRLSTAAPLTNEETQLHRLLALSAASYLKDTLRNGDRLGVDGGRTMGFLAEALAEQNLYQKQVRVISLVGNPPFLHLAGKTIEARSADYVAARITRSFADAVPQFCYFSHFENPSILQRLPTMQPNVAIFGVGNVYPDVYHLVTDSEDPLTEPLRIGGIDLPEEIKSGIGEVASAISQAGIEEANLYHPVGEILGRFFLIPPPSNLDPFVPKDSWKRLERSVQAVNERVFAISNEDLLSAPVRILVAGGLHKLFAIRQLLESGFANRLITDRVTAQRLNQLSIPHTLTPIQPTDTTLTSRLYNPFAYAREHK